VTSVKPLLQAASTDVVRGTTGLTSDGTPESGETTPAMSADSASTRPSSAAHSGPSVQ
jgi:hypothetical protein